VRSLKILLLNLFALACVALMLPASQAQKPAGTAAFAKSVQPFLAEHCYACHNAEQKSGGLNLQVYKATSSITENREIWELVVQKLRTGQMPPKGLPRPAKATLEAVTRWIEQEFARADRLAKPDPGRVTARRLNRTEYNNTVRDLLGIDIEAANDFPQDDSAHGFDNIADALSLSPTLMEKYMAAAEKISRLAVFGPELKPLTFRIEPTRPRRMEANPVRIEEPPFYTMFDYDVTGISHPGSYHLTHRFPASGEYLFRVRADGARPQGSEPQQMDLYLDGRIVQTFEVPDKVTETNERLPVFMEVRLKIPAGQHQLIAAFPRLFEGLSPVIGGPNPSKRPQPPPPDPEKFFPPLPANATPAQIENRKAAIERFRSRKPQFGGFAIAEFEIVGPYDYVKTQSPETRQKLYTCGHLDGTHQSGCQRRMIADLARRAFRRPVEPAEVDKLVAIASKAQQRGRSFEQAMALTVQAILVSPDFLFRIEKNRNPQSATASYRISAHELASRLSYFLWSSMPDDELLRSADRGTLHQPAVLSAQVRRMLQDEKSRALVENFAGQWLEIRRLESVQPDRDRFPDFDDYLRHSMLRETELFFRNIIEEDRSIVDFVAGKYSFLNERLARHYGIKGVSGPEFRKVDLTGSGRTGILTHASVLTVSSYGNRTSPVLRGKWILENLLNAPPPPPPGNVPALDEAAIGTTGTLRQQMEQHRQNPVCSSCHAQMDPLGFSLENYNAVGAWRTQDGKFEIDTTGSLPDGRSLKSAEDLIKILKTERQAFAEGLTEKLLTYALGRGVEQPDRVAVKKIAANLAAREYRFSGLVLEIARSLPFQMRRGEQTK
jgi:mono/diheme cytochrome c family protein